MINFLAGFTVFIGLLFVSSSIGDVASQMRRANDLKAIEVGTTNPLKNSLDAIAQEMAEASKSRRTETQTFPPVFPGPAIPVAPAN